MSQSGAVHFDAAEVGVGDRAELVREAVSNGVSPVNLEHLQGDGRPIDMRLDVKVLGPLAVQSLRFSATAARRTERMAHDESPHSLFVICKRVGSTKVVQDGRESVVDAGGLFLLDSSKPSLVVSDEQTHQDVVQIPVDHLGLPEASLRQALALCLGPELPLAGVLGRFIDNLTTVPDMPPAEADHLARATVDLVRGLITTAVGDPRPARDSLDATLGLRVTDYLHANWREHDLTADRLAAAHHISTRQLYRLLAAQGIHLGDWLRERRLEASRDELARAGAAAGTIAGVGRRWGFPDATNFGRAFKATYGLSPLQWRQLHQTAPNSPGTRP